MFRSDSYWYFDDLGLVSYNSKPKLVQAFKLLIINATLSSTLGNCVFNTIYPELASTSSTLAATCVQATTGNTYIHALTTRTRKNGRLFELVCQLIAIQKLQPLLQRTLALLPRLRHWEEGLIGCQPGISSHWLLVSELEFLPSW
jgi:hypothetical protein